MRLAPTFAVLLAACVAGAAYAQPAPSSPPQADKAAPQPATPAAESSTASDADKALAIAMRMQREREERIARVLCDNGDKAKCDQLANAATTPKTPSP